MRLLLIRHGLTAETGKRLTGRLPGVGLSDEGKAQVDRLGERLAALRVDAMYTSPVLRCRETARGLAKYWGARPIPYRSFAEVDYGSWAGRSLGSLRRTRAWKWLHVTPARTRFPGGESLPEVQVRAVGACEELASRHGDDRVVVVSHADVIRTVVNHYVGAPLDLYQRLEVAPASVSALDLPPEGIPRVITVNRTPGEGL